jgi:hypothetical protein
MTAAANCTFLLQPFRQLARQRLRARREADALEPRRGAPIRFGEIETVNRGEERELFLQLHLRVEAALLRQIADAMPHGQNVARAEQLHRSAVTPIDAERRADRGRLARAVRSEQTENRSRFDGQIEAIERTRAVEGLDELSADERRHRVGREPNYRWRVWAPVGQQKGPGVLLPALDRICESRIPSPIRSSPD